MLTELGLNLEGGGVLLGVAGVNCAFLEEGGVKRSIWNIIHTYVHKSHTSNAVLIKIISQMRVKTTICA